MEFLHNLRGTMNTWLMFWACNRTDKPYTDFRPTSGWIHTCITDQATGWARSGSIMAACSSTLGVLCQNRRSTGPRPPGPPSRPLLQHRRTYLFLSILAGTAAIDAASPCGSSSGTPKIRPEDKPNPGVLWYGPGSRVPGPGARGPEPPGPGPRAPPRAPV